MQVLSESDLDNLEWAKEFIDRYEKRKKITKRAENDENEGE